jgi:hypothetical protein
VAAHACSPSARSSPLLPATINTLKIVRPDVRTLFYIHSGSVLLRALQARKRVDHEAVDWKPHTCARSAIW